MAVTKTAGIKTVLFPVEDLAKAKALFRALMGEPQQDTPYYVGYNIDGHDIGLVPNGHRPGQHGKGMTGPVCFWHVDDIRASLQALLDAGAEAHDDVRDDPAAYDREAARPKAMFDENITRNGR